MENNNEQKPITQEELVATLLKFSDEILFPMMQTMSDETNQRIDDLKQEVTGIKQEVTGIKQEVTGIKQEVAGINDRLDEHETLIYRLIENGDKTDRRLSNMEKQLAGLRQVESEDVVAVNDDVVKVKKIVQNHELRLRALEA